MATSTAPYVLQGTLSVALPDQQEVPLPFGLSGSFSELMSQRLSMTGSGTTPVAFGTITGAKALLLKYEATQGAAVVKLHINGSTDDLELSPGGVFLFGSPNPTEGFVSLSIEHTADADMTVLILG